MNWMRLIPWASEHAAAGSGTGGCHRPARSSSSIGISANSAIDRLRTRTLCPSSNLCKRIWWPFRNRIASRYRKDEAVSCVNVTSSVRRTFISRCKYSGISHTRSRAPGGMHTATTHWDRRGLGIPLRPDHTFLSRTVSGLGSGCKSTGDAKPIAPHANLWATSSSPSLAKRLGKDINE